MPIYSTSNAAIPSRPRKTMSDIYNWYRSGILHYGPYRSYFNAGSQSQNGMKNKQYSPERHIEQRSEGEGKQHIPEVQQAKATEVKTENIENQNTSKIETSQKIESQEISETQKEQTEYQNKASPFDDSEYQKLGLPESYERTFGQTEAIQKRSRSPDPYDRAETMW